MQSPEKTGGNLRVFLIGFRGRPLFKGPKRAFLPAETSLPGAGLEWSWKRNEPESQIPSVEYDAVCVHADQSDEGEAGDHFDSLQAADLVFENWPRPAGEMAAGESCTVTLAFAPPTAGAFSEECTVNTDDGSVSITVSGTRTGTTAAAPVLTPVAINFDDQASGSTSTPQIVTLFNPTAKPLTISNYTLTGDLADFNWTDVTCYVSGFIQTPVDAGTSCAFPMTFNPQSAGSFSAKLTV